MEVNMQYRVSVAWHIFYLGKKKKNYALRHSLTSHFGEYNLHLILEHIKMDRVIPS